ncbi:unnamed protein product, partial [Adineta steineri]
AVSVPDCSTWIPIWISPTNMSRRTSSTRKTTQNQNESTGESEEENEITPDYDRDTGRFFMMQFNACGQSIGEFIKLCHATNCKLKNTKDREFTQMLKEKVDTQLNEELENELKMYRRRLKMINNESMKLIKLN